MIHFLVQLQDLLGEYQDIHVSLDRLRPLGQDGFEVVAPATLDVLDRLREERGQRALALRRGFADTFEPIVGPAWKRLKSELGAGM